MFDFLRNLFAPKKSEKAPTSDNVVTAPLSEAQLQSIKAMALNRYEPPQLLVASAQSVGRQRELNEDSLFTLTTTIAGNSSNPPFGLFIIADGMGGHQYGEVASNAAIRSVSGYVMRKFHNSLFNMPSMPVDESLQEIIQAAVMEAQRAVLREAPGSGTTVTAALVLGQQLTIAHVGDSRAYLLYGEQRMEAVTRDHSLVRRLEELGQITPAEAAVHPQRNVLYRALGQGESLDPDVVTTPFPIGGYLLLCSDGLWGVIPEDEMRRIVYEAPTIQRACQDLVAAANSAGGPDNITVVLAHLLS
ncbi:MAG: serine/threonine-protein phosphatase [Chloroflexi bacterium]|nr:MAG: serine/threonine-protein phosphatase [Chloroflexota bacterium]